mgnify:FL=1
MSNKKICKDVQSKLGIISLGYKKNIVCIVLNKSKVFHNSYNVYADNNFYCIHKKSLKFL